MPVSGLSPDTYLFTVSAVFDGISAVVGPVAPKSLEMRNGPAHDTGLSDDA